MNLRLRNTWKYLEKDQWDWSVFVEDDDSGDLDKIDSVQYILHPTFNNPVQIRKDRESKFQLNTRGWGTFLIRAFVNTTDGDRIKLEHELELYYEPKEGTSE